MLRLFLAISLDSKTRIHLMKWQEALAKNNIGVNWTHPENLHLTLQFFGNVSRQDLSKLCASIGNIETHTRRFCFTIAGIGAFPDLATARVIWAGIDAGEKNLRSLRSHLDQHTKEAGFLSKRERFVPHITLGRFRRPRFVDLPLIEPWPESIFVRDIRLYESISTHYRPRYNLIRKFDLL